MDEKLLGKYVEIIIIPDDGGEELTVSGTVVDIDRGHSVTILDDEDDILTVRPPFDLFILD